MIVLIQKREIKLQNMNRIIKRYAGDTIWYRTHLSNNINFQEVKHMDTKPGKQESTKELTEEAKKVETFNPLWHDGEFLGPNAVRFKDVEDEGEET